MTEHPIGGAHPRANKLSSARQAFDRAFLAAAETAVHFLAHHWLLLANTINALLFASPFLAPIFMAAGITWAARVIYTAYGVFYTQIPSHSYVIFGHMMAYGHRAVAIDGALVVGGILFALLRRRLRPLPLGLLLLFTAPTAIDGFTQLFGWRESTWELRSVTGALFGLGAVWFAYPWIEGGMRRVHLRTARHT